jgi:hypothetical protein
VTFDPGTGVVNAAGVTAVDPGRTLASVACPSDSQCTAVDESGNEVTFDPAAPAGFHPARIRGASGFYGVACSSVSQCVAVDVTGHAFTGRFAPRLSLRVPSAGTAGRLIAAASVSAALSKGASPRGTITFKVFGPRSSAPAVCASGGTTLGTAGVSGDRTYHPSAGFKPSTPGDYWWFAIYGGDQGNNPVSSACGASMPKMVVHAR